MISNTISYNPQLQKAYIMRDTNNESVAYFKNIKTGVFTEVAHIRNGIELDHFMDIYDLATITVA